MDNEGSWPTSNGTVRCPITGLTSCIPECYDLCCHFALCLCGCGRRTVPACSFFAERSTCAVFSLARRPTLLTIPGGGLPCGGGNLRREGLHAFLCPADATATGRVLAGCLLADRGFTPGGCPHTRGCRHRLCRRRCRLLRQRQRHFHSPDDPVGVPGPTAAQRSLLPRCGLACWGAVCCSDASPASHRHGGLLPGPGTAAHRRPAPPGDPVGPTSGESCSPQLV